MAGWKIWVLLAWTCFSLAACGSSRRLVSASSLTPEEQRVRWDAFRATGPHHERLARHVGTWTWTGSLWADPAAEAEPRASEGRSVFEVGMDGRFLMESASGSMMDIPFFGEGRLGFDNASGEHLSFWIDNLGTGMSFLRGRCSGRCELITFRGEVTDPITGRPSPTKLIYRWVDDGTFRIETWSEPTEGPSIKTMDVVYTRS